MWLIRNIFIVSGSRCSCTRPRSRSTRPRSRGCGTSSRWRGARGGASRRGNSGRRHSSTGPIQMGPLQTNLAWAKSWTGRPSHYLKYSSLRTDIKKWCFWLFNWCSRLRFSKKSEAQLCHFLFAMLNNANAMQKCKLTLNLLDDQGLFEGFPTFRTGRKGRRCSWWTSRGASTCTPPCRPQSSRTSSRSTRG